MASIRERNDSYQITVSCGYDSQGKKITETTTFTPDPAKTTRQNEKTLELFVLEFEQRVKKGKFLSGEKMTLADFFEEYKKEATEQLQATSFDSIIYSFAHIIPHLGHMKLNQINPLLIRNMLKKWQEKGYTTPTSRHKDYSATTIKIRLHALQSCLEYAVRMNVLNENPCRNVNHR